MNFRNLPRRALRRLVTQLGIWLVEAEPGVGARTLPRFANQPKRLIIDLPRRIINPECMSFGDNVWLGPGAFISAVRHYPSPSLIHPEKVHEIRTYSPQICIGHRVISSGQLIIGAVKQIDIDDDVLLSSNVTILDNLHGYQAPDEPFKYQPLQRIAPVVVKRGCWIGQNTVILPGVTVGEMSIIGANSVVTKSIPDRSIAFGAPARVMKRWDENRREWRPCAAPCAEVAAIYARG
jgi:acetyltransferase-like isoleucine patch superfamily enzyme